MVSCSGHGQCSDGKSGNGHCTCEAHFTGTACEKCVNGKYGRNCTEGERLGRFSGSDEVSTCDYFVSYVLQQSY